MQLSIALPARCANAYVPFIPACSLLHEKVFTASGITWRGDDAANAGDVFQSKLEEHQLHGLLADGVVV